MKSTSSVHGHEVMHILSDKGPLSRSTLSEMVTLQFGEEARFHTCSAENMNLSELLQFLLDRSKISESVAGLSMGSDQHICDHE